MNRVGFRLISNLARHAFAPRILAAVALLAAFPAAACAQHSDIVVRVRSNDNQLVTSQAGGAGSGRVFVSTFDQSSAPGAVFGDPGFLQAFFGDDPGFASGTAGGGFSLLPASTQLRMNLLPFRQPGGTAHNFVVWDGQNGINFVPPPANYSLTFEGEGASTVVLDGSANVQEGLVLGRTSSNGGLHEHVDFFVDDGPLLATPQTAPIQGAYLYAGELTMDSRGTSDPFLVAVGSLGISPQQLTEIESWAESNLPSLEFGPFADDAPFVTEVSVGASGWSAGFLDGQGYSIPTGAEQLDSLPWTGLDQIRIAFSEDVDVTAEDLSIQGSSATAYGIAGFEYDEASLTATWTLDTAIVDDDLQLTLSDAVSDASMNLLDGEWSDGVSIVSGDGEAGGDFEYGLRVVPGDVDRSGGLSEEDVDSILADQFLLAGEAEYSIFSDLNGSGSIFADDAILARNHWRLNSIVEDFNFQALAPVSSSLLPASGSNSVPEPSGLLLTCAGLLAWAAMSRRSLRRRLR